MENKEKFDYEAMKSDMVTALYQSIKDDLDVITNEFIKEIGKRNCFSNDEIDQLLIIATVLYHRYYRDFVDAEEICDCYLELRNKNLFNLDDTDASICFIDAFCKRKKEGESNFCQDFTEMLQSYKSGELRKTYI